MILYIYTWIPYTYIHTFLRTNTYVLYIYYIVHPHIVIHLSRLDTYDCYSVYQNFYLSIVYYIYYIVDYYYQ